MLAHSGKLRTFRDNALLGLALALIGGFLNASGLAVLGIVTSHVTGHWTNFGREIARTEWSSALRFGEIIAAFLGGAIFSTFLIETNRSERMRSIYVRPLVVAWLLVGVFAVWGSSVSALSPGWQQVVTCWLCFVCGLMNAMLSRITGGAVRGTHMTGITTDLGIELAKLTLATRQRLASVAAKGGGAGALAGELRAIMRDDVSQRFRLFGTMLLSFFGGAILGTLCVLRWDSLGTLPAFVFLGLLVTRELLELRRELAHEKREKLRVADLAARITLPPPREIAPAPLEAAPGLPERRSVT